MSEPLSCYRCGTSLARLTLPLSRLDECPECVVHLHVCRMCVHYAPGKPKQCTEDDAIEVRDKHSANFCDYFAPNARAFAGNEMAAEKRAREQLAALFGNAAEPPEGPASADPSPGAPASASPSPNGPRSARRSPAEPSSADLSPDELARRQAEALFKK